MANIRRFVVGCAWPLVIALGAASCGELAAPDEASTEQDVVTGCQQPVAPGPAISFERELVLRNLHVVEDGVAGDGSDHTNDHCRTTWNAACPPALQGRWTFGWMMAVMSGVTDVTNPTAKTFVKNWLKLWLSAQQPNPNKAAARPRTAITEALIKPWLLASGCSSADTIDTCALDLKKAPFRLLAFVNRADLPSIAGYSAGGEFRVVFGALGFDPNCAGCGTNTPLQATVILEYNYPATRSLISWASQMHALSGLDPESASSTVTYRNQLQAITDGIVGPIPVPPPIAINHSAISHVRTNEIAFDCQSGTAPCDGADPDSTAAQWESRQFKLGPSGQLVPDPVSQTPQTADNNTPSINNQLISYWQACEAGDPAFHDADAALLGNSSLSPSGGGAVIWERNVLTSTNSSPSTPADRLQARHLFAFGTCNGCHYFETSNQLGFFHIAPRLPGTTSGISSFLSVNGAADPIATSDNVNPSYYQTVNNASGGTTTFLYNEPWRRACEIRRILSGNPTPYTKPSGHIQ